MKSKKLIIVGKQEKDPRFVPLENYITMLTLFFIVMLIFNFAMHRNTYSAEGNRSIIDDILKDGILDAEEESMLLSLDCEALKRELGTDKEVYLYILDEGGNALPISGKRTIVGCLGPLEGTTG